MEAFEPEADDTLPCPIEDLVADLASEGRASLEWVVRFSQGEGDPVAVAWEQAREPFAMLHVLDLGDQLESSALFDALIREIASWPEGVVDPRVGDPAFRAWAVVSQRFAEVIRAAVPTPPSLSVLHADPQRARRPGRFPLSGLRELVDPIDAGELPSNGWIVQHATEGHDPVRSQWEIDAPAAARVLSRANPELLAHVLTRVAESLRGAAQARYSGLTTEYDAHGADVSLAVAAHLDDAIADLEGCVATLREGEGDEAYDAFELVLSRARSGRPGSDMVWEFVTSEIAGVERAERPRLHEVLAAWDWAPSPEE